MTKTRFDGALRHRRLLMTLSSLVVVFATIQFASLVQASEFPERECCDHQSASGGGGGGGGVLVAHLPPDLASPPAGTGHVSKSPSSDMNFDSGHQVDHHQPDDTSIAAGGGGVIDMGSGSGTPMDSLDFLYPEFIPELTGSHHHHPASGGGGGGGFYPPTPSTPTSSTGF